MKRWKEIAIPSAVTKTLTGTMKENALMFAQIVYIPVVQEVGKLPPKGKRPRRKLTK